MCRQKSARSTFCLVFRNVLDVCLCLCMKQTEVDEERIFMVIFQSLLVNVWGGLKIDAINSKNTDKGRKNYLKKTNLVDFSLRCYLQIT